MRSIKFVNLIATVLLAMSSYAMAQCGPTPLEISPDSVGQALQSSMIWAAPEVSKPAYARFIAFRKQFDLKENPAAATMRLFADARYICWINGRYACRGPARFNPLGPEYDSIDIRQFLTAGNNTIAVVVLANASSSKIMMHAPGLTARMEIALASGDRSTIVTDGSWKWSGKTRYRAANVSWPNVEDRIDTRVEDGDWTQTQYDDRGWKTAAAISGNAWGPLTARRIPMLRETPLDAKLTDGQNLPVTITAGQTITFDVGRMSQAYTTLDLDASDGATFDVFYESAHYRYIARAGRQSYMSSDTCAMQKVRFTIKSGSVTLYSFKPVERLYPFDTVGSFHSNDPGLDRIWSMCARSLQLLSEDAYVDCADRERAEWMDCDPPVFNETRTAMAGPDGHGGEIYSDPRLYEELLRRTALSVQPEGWVKAHTCSDRFDVHALMEDRGCDWIEGARQYYDCSGNPAPIREIWPVIVRQLKWFMDRRTERGLVNAREWVFWANPMGYVTCEGAGLNAYVYRALVDAAYLGNSIGAKQQAAEYTKSAEAIKSAFNEFLWDEKNRTYFSGFYTKGPNTKPDTDQFNKVSLPVTNGQVEATVFPAIIALDQGIVPDERRQSVMAYMVAHRAEVYKFTHLMAYYYLFDQLYHADAAALDLEVLNKIRSQWKQMADWGTSWEAIDPAGSKVHCYGLFPGYLLSNYVLGVRVAGLTSEKNILIEPRLGDLTLAEGSVSTPFGLVPVSWKTQGNKLSFQLTVPQGASAKLRLADADNSTILLDGQYVQSEQEGRYCVFRCSAGTHEGSLVLKP